MHKEVYLRLFIKALFVTGKTCKQLKCLTEFKKKAYLPTITMKQFKEGYGVFVVIVVFVLF